MVFFSPRAAEFGGYDVTVSNIDLCILSEPGRKAGLHKSGIDIPLCRKMSGYVPSEVSRVFIGVIERDIVPRSM